MLTQKLLFLLLSTPRRALSHTPASLHINQTQHCKQLPGMVSSQAQLCRSNLELMQTIIQAAREVKKTCQKTFADMRWNCSSIDIPIDAPKYRPDLDRGKLYEPNRRTGQKGLLPLKTCSSCFMPTILYSLIQRAKSQQQLAQAALCYKVKTPR